MTKKTYEIVAEAIAAVSNNIETSRAWTPTETNTAHVALLALTERLASDFQTDNERFDRDRFLEAAGQ